jgi:hypothetical protein
MGDLFPPWVAFVFVGLLVLLLLFLLLSDTLSDRRDRRAKGEGKDPRERDRDA